jgi:large repetitive protein
MNSGLPDRDGTSGAGDRPVHVYKRPGRYQVALIIEGDPLPRCSNVDTDWVNVRVDQTPTAIIKAPDLASTGKPVRFAAAPSTEPGDPAIREFEWAFGDGQTAQGPNVTHTFETSGVYQVMLTLKGDAEASGCGSGQIVHGITVNAPPVADFATPTRATVDEPVLFDAALSGDPDGMITAYKWDFGDGGKEEGIRASHVYRAPGAFAAQAIDCNCPVKSRSPAYSSLTKYVERRDDRSHGSRRDLVRHPAAYPHSLSVSGRR